MKMNNSTGTTEIVLLVNGSEETYRCGRHEIRKEINFFSVFSNVDVIGVRDSKTKEWIERDVAEVA